MLHDFVNVNAFNSVTSPDVLSYRCVLHYFLTMPVSFNFNLTFGLKQVGAIKVVTVYKRSIFQLEWLIATLIFYTRQHNVHGKFGNDTRLFAGSLP